MGIIEIPFILVAIIIGYIFHNISEKARQENTDLINSVTNLSRGTPSERHLILTLLKYGIHPNAIFHDLYILKPNGTTSQIDVVVATSVGIIVFEVKDHEI